MAELAQTINLSKLISISNNTSTNNSTIPLNNTTPLENVSYTGALTDKIDVSKLNEIQKNSQNKNQNDSVVISEDGINRDYIIGTEEPSTKEKIAYGLDKQNMFFGNVFRVAKAGITAAFDPEKEFKEVALDNAANERAALYNRHEKFRGGKYDDDIEVLASEMATFLVDPYYIFMYMTPWGRAMSMRQTGIKSFAKVAGLSAGTVSLDKLFDNLASTGEVNPKDIAQAGALAGVLGPASMKAFQIIGKLLPKADKSKIAQIIQVVEGKTQTQLGVTKAEFKTLQKIAGDKEFLALNKQVSNAENAIGRFIKPIAKEQDIFYKSVLKVDNKINKLKANLKLAKKKDIKFTYKDKTIKNISDKINLIEKTERLRKKTFDKAQTALWKKQSIGAKKVADLTAKRDVRFLEKLWKEKGLTEKTAQVVLSASVRPLMGAAVGYGFGKLWGPDDANLNRWMLVGATLGLTHKGIQASKIIPGQSKSMIQNLLYRDATKFSFQKVRELTSTTTSSKLAAIGGETEKIGLQLLENIDSAFAKNSVTQRSDNLLRQWQLRTANVNKPYNLNEQAQALSVIRGSKEKVTSRVKTLAGKLEKELQDFKKLREEAGIFSLNEDKTSKSFGKLMEIKNYFPRVYNFNEIKKDPKKFEKVLIDIFKSLGRTDKQAKSEAMSFSKTLYNADDSIINKEAVSSFIDGTATKVGVLKNNPLSEHITKARILEGPYAKVEKVLEKNGYLVNNANDVLFNLYNRSMKSIAFAEKFGNQGQLLKPYMQNIVQKYKDAVGKQFGITNENWKAKARAEIDLVTNTIDGYFGRYGTKKLGVSKSIAGTLATISNLNMLDRVTIASLGDIAQPFTLSNNYLSFWKGALRTGFTNRRETGIGKNLNQNLDNEIRGWLLKAGDKVKKKRNNLQTVMGEEAVLKFDDATMAANVMGEMGVLRKVNEVGFKIMGLQWLTGLARRYAYNVGAVDAYTSATKLAKFVSANGKRSLSSKKGLKLVKDLNKYSINAEDGLRLGVFNTFDDAVANKTGKKILNQSGILASNRDALIPQVSNRLLFAQSRNPWVRLMGQFTSWAMAKSTQTNKILQRIENGETRQMVKLLAALPVYGGIQMLREIAKYGEVRTDPAYNTDKWWSEALRLSGISGILPELAIGRLTGPGSRQPWFIPFPAASVATDVWVIGQDALKGETDKATRRFWDKIVPLPTYRRWISKLWEGTEVTRKYKNKSNYDNLIKPQKFSYGGSVIKRKKYSTGELAENIDMEKLNSLNTNMIEEDNSTLTNNDLYIVGDNLNKKLKFTEEKIIEPHVEEKQIYPKKRPNQIDWNWIGEREGVGKEIGYVPTNNNNKIIGTSGITIATGVDLGTKDRKFFNNMDVSEKIITKLEPFFGLKGTEALEQAKKLKLSASEVKELDTAIKKKYSKDIINQYEKDSGKNFENLTPQQQTVITSVAFQHGLKATTGYNFWKQVTTDDWDGAIANLRDWDGTGKPSQTQERRDLEANLLANIFVDK